MRCEQIMKRDVKFVSPRDTVDDAACLMRDENVGFLPVCDDSRRVLGALTDRDIAVRLVASKKPASTFVEEIMTRGGVACRPRDDASEASRLMSESQKSRIICCNDDGTIAGVISLSDLPARESRARQATRPADEEDVHLYK
jgi:CBS domain-containing protein